MSNKINVTICGGGNGAHTLAGISSLVKTANLTVLDIYENEAETWTNAKASQGFSVKFSNGDLLYQPPGKVNFEVTNSVKASIPNADMVIICVPAYTHEIYINAIGPYLRNDCLVVGMPGHPGFEYQCASLLKCLGKTCPLVSLETLPWACRILNYGYEVGVVGTKDEVVCSIVESKQAGHPVNKITLDMIQNLLGDKPVLKSSNSVIECTLLAKSTIHPPIMYAKWRSWDGQKVDKPPLFYQGVDEDAIKFLDDVNNEVMATAAELSQRRPELKLSGQIPTMKEWFIEHYCDQIDDKSSLLSCLKTNSAYAGLLHPIKKLSDGGFVPDFSYRYTTEDIPYGLVVLRQIAGMVGVATPVMDTIITWAQSKIGVTFLEGGAFCDVGRSRARILRDYGIHDVDDLVNFFDGK